MPVYLEDIALSEAINRFDKALVDINRSGRLGIESINLDENAVGRVVAEPIWAKISSPHYHASAMDGFALRATLTVGASPKAPITLVCNNRNGQSQVAYLDTGDPLPDWADTVIPVENIEPVGPGGEICNDVRHPYAIRIRSAIVPWQHIRPMGEDMVATQLVLPAGHKIRPVDLGAIAASGNTEIRVAIKPRIGIIPTGSELVKIGEVVRKGQIIEFNSIMLAAQINQWGGIARKYEIVKDSLENIQLIVSHAAKENDLILLLAGSSAGSEDYSTQVVESLGRLFVHGVAVRPGHPVILGIIDDIEKSYSIPIVGVPGYPVSAVLTGEIFIEPLISKWLGCQPAKPDLVKAKLTKKVTSQPGDDDYLRVVVAEVGEQVLAAPLSKGSGVITSLVKADGIVIVPSGVQGYEANTEVEVRLYNSTRQLNLTILAVGSHDMVLDLASQYLAGFDRRIVSSNVGSLAGLIALNRGEAHLAGSHLLDPETGTYNLSYIQQYLQGVPIKIIGFVRRQQGLIVVKGNPKRLFSINDFNRNDILIVNRQRGAGTRVLLDYQLNLAGINKDSVRGYNYEEYTHLAVAVAVTSGRADVGLGIAAAAQALDLDFIPLFDEEYDLVIPALYYESRLMAPLLSMLNDQYFRDMVSRLPGYNSSPMGVLKYVSR